jgi:hypothetical protein
MNNVERYRIGDQDVVSYTSRLGCVTYNPRGLNKNNSGEKVGDSLRKNYLYLYLQHYQYEWRLERRRTEGDR